MQTQNVNDVIDHLAAKLSVPTAHLWQVLVTQQRVSVVQNAIGALTSSIIVVAFLLNRKRIHAWVEDDAAYGDRGMVLTIGYALVGLAVGLTLNCVSDMIGLLLNPEYYALKEILSAFK